MQRYSVPALLILAIMSLFWAYTVIDLLLREFSAHVTFIDLAVLVVLGFIAGLAVGLTPAVWRRGNSNEGFR
jgi:hypothetical protein